MPVCVWAAGVVSCVQLRYAVSRRARKVSSYIVRRPYMECLHLQTGGHTLIGQPAVGPLQRSWHCAQAWASSHQPFHSKYCLLT